MTRKKAFSALFGLLALALQAQPLLAKPIQLNDKTNFLRLVIPENEAKQATISYISNSFQNHDIDVKDLWPGQWIKVEVFDANDKIPPFTQLPVAFSARKEDSLFYITVQDNLQTDLITSLKLLNSNKVFFMDDQMSHETSLVIKASPSATLSVINKPLNPDDLALPPIPIGEDTKDFLMSKTLFIQLVTKK